MEIPELLTPHEAAKALHTTYGSLAVWRCTRRHPLAFVRVGRKIFYKKADIEQFIDLSRDPGNGEKPHRRKRGGR